MILILASVVIISLGNNCCIYSSYSLGLEPPSSKLDPVVKDSDLRIEEVAEGLELPTTMAFIGDNDFLVLEKEKGTVRRVVNSTILEEPILDLNVATEIDRGLLGIAALQYGQGKKYVFLYYSESNSANGNYSGENEIEKVSNRLYRYEFVDGELVRPTLLLDLPATPNRHPGGQLLIGPNRDVYLTFGDLNQNTTAQNNDTGVQPVGTSAILRLSLDGKPVLGEDREGILGDEYPLNMYYAYGIRNSFGIDFDPATGDLWDTENGESVGDEINLVKPGFNSGWNKVQGVWVGTVSEPNESEKYIFDSNDAVLVDFDGKGRYSEPELSWYENAGLTALRFLNSSIYGEEFENDMFVGDFNNGYLYHFDLNEDRTELSLDGDLEDKIVHHSQEINKKIFGQGFAGISDIEVGPDGYLYIISIGQGKVFKIMNKER
jgi:glucose/arabinose dehydrogenase